MNNMTLGKRWLALGAMTVLALPAWAINNGIPTTAFAAVGQGVQVAPNWVLATYHFASSVGQGYTNDYGQFNVAARYDAPGSGPNGANDLTLLRLEGSSAAPYLPVYDTFIPNGPFGPWNATIVTDNNSGPTSSYGWTTVSESQVVVDPDDSGPLGPVTANYVVSFDRQVYVQNGDSSGGLFYGHVLDSSVLLGITSTQYTEFDNPDVPIGSGFVQIAAYRAWIDSVMAADTADNQVLHWVSSVPEPGTWLLWAAGVGLLASRRRLRHA